MVYRKLVRRPVSDKPANFSENIPPLLQQIYLSRGVVSESEISTELKSLLSPKLKGLPLAAKLLADAIEANQRILIVGDFDADGATSTALGLLAFTAMGAKHVDFLVPNRFEYGYGLTPEIVFVAAEMQPDIIVTVDNGISSIEGVAAAKALGIQVVVTDHHLPGDELPEADAIVNPNQPGCDFPSKALAGVGVMFYVLSGLRNELKQRTWFERQNIAVPNLGEFLDLVALGTVADVVPLDQNNRILVENGLRRIRANRARPGIQALLQIAKRQPHRLVASDLGFAVGPRLNAAGRLDDMSLGIRCLMAESAQEAQLLASELDSLNLERREIEQGMQQEALKSLESIALSEESLPWGICLHQDTWHQGVVGIVASRIKDKFHRPTIAFAEADENELKGSARSIPGVHMRDTLDLVAKRYPQLLTKFGGHAMAAGLSLAKENYQAFSEAFSEILAEQNDKSLLSASLMTDGALAGADINLANAQMLRQGGPWGQHFPEPIFEGEFQIVQQRIVGAAHLKLVLADVENPQDVIDAIAFNVDLAVWPNEGIKRAHLAYKLDVNEFRGRVSPQLMVEELQPL